MNLGTLNAQSTSQSMSILVRSNAGFSVFLSSQNNGVLKHTAASIQTTVPYSIQVNSVPKSLSGSAGSPVKVASGSGQTSQSGVANTLMVTTGATNQSMAGQYLDNITVTVVTTE